MVDYQVKVETVTVAGVGYLIRSLLDLQQYDDPDGLAELAGISSASWSLFGHIWPSARVLALSMQTIDLQGKRVLEIGAGLALASLVVHRREGDVTVSDWHPLCESFLIKNLTLNQLGALKYQIGNWAVPNTSLGKFELIIGSDILYERQQADQLAGFIHSHAAQAVQVIIVDPDRGNRVKFCQRMSELGFEYTGWRAEKLTEAGEPFKGSFLNFTRNVRQVLV